MRVGVHAGELVGVILAAAFNSFVEQDCRLVSAGSTVMRKGSATTGLRKKLLRLAAARGDDRSWEVLEALCRLENGAYGICKGCGRTIPEKRLYAKPEAIRCVGCQSVLERGPVA